VGFVVDKVALGQVFSEYFGFPCQSSFHRIILHPHNHRGRHNRTVNGRGAEWTQFGLHPPLYAKKNKKNEMLGLVCGAECGKREANVVPDVFRFGCDHFSPVHSKFISHQSSVIGSYTVYILTASLDKPQKREKYTKL
jgi:hypothetical protein